ncbi:granulin repeat cysteine protease family protein [Actinidia rufa]|uniref:Granulin repeat cysteine protease family protein n=1 Tax=Actinidia rufa TaxID=165716 RepID=A0A7J0G5S4_9ERIC|nr:granulin repeat cysteine protease family protein [Actinidia rufa]
MGAQNSQLFALVIFLVWASLTSLISSSLPSEFSIVGRPGESIAEERVVELFKKWTEKHGKVYKHGQEAEKKFRNFRDNLRYVMEKNGERGAIGGHLVGLNKFADMSNEEFREVYVSKVKKPTSKRMAIERRRQGKAAAAKAVAACDGPTSLDWRKYGIVTGVKDQGDCGGYMDYAFEWVMSNGGIDTETDYPYTGEDGTCNTTKEETKAVSIDGYEDVAEEESALFCAVLKQPISVGIDGGAIDFQLYTGGIYDGDCSDDPDDIDHAVLVVESSAPSPYPSPAVPPPPPPPPPPPSPPPPPPPPSPSPTQCGDFSYCAATETCCCIFEFFDYCLIYGCCDYTDAVCCTGTEYCCPHDYPICDIEEGLCLQNDGDFLGVAAKKRKMAKHKYPWTKPEDSAKNHQPLEWKRNRFAAVR